MEYITTREAMEVLKITSRKTLNDYCKKYEIEYKSQKGKSNLYLKSDILKVEEITLPLKEKYNKRHINKAEKHYQNINEKKEMLQQEQEQQPKENLLFGVLEEVGAEYFHKLKKQLKEMGIYEEIDQAVLITYCKSYEGFIKYSNKEFVQVDHNGNLKLSPYFKIFNTFVDQMSKTGSMLGLGIRNRIGLNIKEPQKEKSIFDLIEEF